MAQRIRIILCHQSGLGSGKIYENCHKDCMGGNSLTKGISIIVPIYHGQKYIESIIEQVEAAAKELKGLETVELVLVNDAPEETLRQYNSEYIDIVVFNTDRNRGIHGARVHGLSKAKGELIVFLDQDDKISTSYIVKQYQNIGSADAVVCMAIHEDKPFYSVVLPFEKVICLEQMITVGNSIVSAGQVMVRKSSIPSVWINNIMKNNGADDWLLWMSMMGQGKKFALNSEILFEHVVEGRNTSWNTVAMWTSEQEVFDIIKRNHILTSEKEQTLENALKEINVTRMKQLDKFRKISYLYNQWLSLWEDGKFVTDCLNQCGYKKVAIYGMTPMGVHLYKQITDENLDVSCFIDRNANNLECEIPIYTLEDELPEVDIVIIALVEYEDKIKKDIQRIMKTDSLTLMELLEKKSENR